MLSFIDIASSARLAAWVFLLLVSLLTIAAILFASLRGNIRKKPGRHLLLLLMASVLIVVFLRVIDNGSGGNQKNGSETKIGDTSGIGSETGNNHKTSPPATPFACSFHLEKDGKLKVQSGDQSSEFPVPGSGRRALREKMAGFLGQTGVEPVLHLTSGAPELARAIVLEQWDEWQALTGRVFKVIDENKAD